MTKTNGREKNAEKTHISNVRVTLSMNTVSERVDRVGITGSSPERTVRSCSLLVRWSVQIHLLIVHDHVTDASREVIQRTERGRVRLRTLSIHSTKLQKKRMSIGRRESLPT